MRIAITGASGLLGTNISDRLRRDGHSITRLVRSREAAAAGDAVYWRPSTGELDVAGLAGHDVVINLAGENIYGLWTPAKKRRIRESRVRGTELLATTLASMPETERPSTLINASAGPGYYGDRPPHDRLDEETAGADDFFGRVVREWESATRPAREAGVRVVVARFAVVVDPDGLLLQAATLATRLGLGAKIGEGDQVFPWVTGREVAEVVTFLLDGGTDLEGPVNVVAPQRVTNQEFVDTLAGVLRRPRFLKIPTPVARLAGGLGNEVLKGTWMVPRKLERAGYRWRDPELEPALREMLNR